jgi:hypothetical protein
MQNALIVGFTGICISSFLSVQVNSIRINANVIQKHYANPYIQHLADNNNCATKSVQFAPVTLTTGKLTITGGTPLPPQPPFPPDTTETGKLTITGGGIPLPPAPPFPGMTITTTPLTISGKSN